MGMPVSNSPSGGHRDIAAVSSPEIYAIVTRSQHGADRGWDQQDAFDHRI